MSEITNVYEVEPVSNSTDYIGFWFNGKHSSELGIVRTSEGSRFNENLLPTIQDKTVQIPGGDGAYYYGSFYTQKTFSISYAFDSLTEEQFAQLKNHFGDKKVHELIFDELPYKVYRAKVTGSASIKHIPFAEGETNRIYKGEGSIQFTAFEPHARSRYKWLDQYSNTNIAEWNGAAKLLETQGNFDKLIDSSFALYNPGVKETDFILTLQFPLSGIIPAGSIYIDANSQLNFNEIKQQNADDSIKINTKLNLIEGYKNGKKTGNIYNRHITKGFFFKIPVTTEIKEPLKLTITDANLAGAIIEYDYIYF